MSNRRSASSEAFTEPRAVFRKIVDDEWLTPLRKLGFSKRASPERVLPGEGLVQILVLHWSRWCSANHVRLGVQAGVATIDGEGLPATRFRLRHVEINRFYGHDSGGYEYEFGDEDAVTNSARLLAELERPNAHSPAVAATRWAMGRNVADPDDARRVVREDFEKLYLPFFELISTAARFEEFDDYERIYPALGAPERLAPRPSGPLASSPREEDFGGRQRP